MFAKRLGRLTDEKIDQIEKAQEVKAQKKRQEEDIRQTFLDKTSLRLTTIKDKMSQSINYEDVRNVLTSPYGRDKHDSRFVDLKIKGKSKIH